MATISVGGSVFEEFATLPEAHRSGMYRPSSVVSGQGSQGSQGHMVVEENVLEGDIEGTIVASSIIEERADTPSH